MPKDSVHEGHLTSGDGLRLFYRERELGSGTAHILLVHGVAEHGGRYRGVEDFLADHSVGLSIMDLRGHGRSEGRRVWVPSFESYLEDLDLLVARTASRSDDVFLAGHSLGGLIAVRYAETRRPRIRGLITSGAALRASVVPPRPVVWALRALNAVWSATPIPGLVKPSQLSRAPEVVRRYVEDPMVPKHLTTGLGLAGLEAGATALAEAHRIGLPTLLLHGGDDAVVDPGGSREMFAKLPVADKRLEIYPGLFHEIFNEPERERVLGDVVEWVRAHAV
jgi:alpha-beta hydrolase superfamily lysophospholipase